MNQHAAALHLRPIRTGASIGAPPPVASADLYMPLTAAVWSAPRTSYKWQLPKGIFWGTKGSTLYAPESGILRPVSDGGFVLEVQDGDNFREWVGGFITDIDKKFVWGEAVAAGQELGTLSSDLILGLKVTPKGNPDKFQMLDPVDVLRRGGAHFKDLEGASGSESTDLAVASAASSELAAPSTFEVLAKKPEFTALHLAMATVGGTLMGWLLTRALSSKRGR